MEVVCNKDGMGGGDFTKTPATPAGRTIRRINAGRTSGTKGLVDIRQELPQMSSKQEPFLMGKAPSVRLPWRWILQARNCACVNLVRQ